MLKKNIFISLFILLMGLLAAFQIVNLKTTQAATDGHGADVVQPKTPRGPHNGRMFTDKDLTVEIQIYETEIPPEFHVFFYREDKPIPVSEVKFSAKILRMGVTDNITFKQEKDYLLSEQIIYEPHSFKAVFEGVYQNRHYQWSFTQEEGRLTIPAELVKRSEISILKAGPQSLSSKLAFPGEIALDQDKYVHIVPPVSGRAIEVHKHVGEHVARGELLAVITSRELADLRLERQLLLQKTQRESFLLNREEKLSTNTRQLLKLLRQKQDPEAIHRQMLQSPVGENKALLMSAFADLRLAHQILQREEQLQKDKITSEEVLETVRTNYENALSHYIATIEEVLWQRESNLTLKRQDLKTAQAEQRALEQKLQVIQVPVNTSGLASARYEVRSPISGVVSEKHLAIGEATQTDKPIFVIANLSVVWVELQVPDTQLAQVHTGQRVRVFSQDGQRESSGTIAHISPVVNSETRRAEAEVHIDNPDGFWRPGMFVNVEVITAERTVPVAVVKTALQSYNDWTVVYAKFGDTFEIRPLELGQEDEQWVEVKAGLKAGQPYAATNSFILKAEIGKKAATHDH